MSTPVSADTVQDLKDQLAAAQSHIRDLQLAVDKADTRLVVLERFMAERFG